MKPFSQGITSTPRSGIRAIMDLAGKHADVIHLEVGEPCFSTPAPIVEAAAAAARAGYTRYTPNKGLRELRDAIVGKLERKNGLRVSAEQVVVTTGGVSACMESLNALLDPGDVALLPGLAWPNYELMVRALHGQVVRYPLLASAGFTPDLGRLEQLARETPRAKVILLNSPSNPTGAVFDRATIERIVEIARASDLYVISDEVYEDILFEGTHVSPGVFDRDGRVISVFSCSKSYAMTGWRIAYLAATPEIADLIAKIQEAHTSCAAGISQKAAEAALLGDQSCVEEMRLGYRARRDRAVELLRAHGLLVSRPEGAFYILADISRAGMGSQDFCVRLLENRRVAVAPGLTFGPDCDGLVRLSLATDLPALEEGIGRLAAEVDALAR